MCINFFQFTGRFWYETRNRHWQQRMAEVKPYRHRKKVANRRKHKQSQNINRL